MRATHLIVAFGIGVALWSATATVRGQEERSAANRAGSSRPWPPQRLADGQPDVQGIWAAVNSNIVCAASKRCILR